MESEAHVDACTLDIKFHQMMKTVVPEYKLVSYTYYNSVCPDGKECDDPKLNSYTLEPLDDKNPKSYYDRLIMEKDKPSLSELNAALNLWKNTVKTKIRFKARVMAVDDDEFKVASHRCGHTEINKAILKKKVIEQMDSDKMDCIEAKAAEFQQEKQELIDRQNARKAAFDKLNTTDCLSLGDEFKKNVCLILKR